MKDTSTFVQLIKDNEALIYKITKAYAHDAEDQKDLYQEVVYQLWKSFKSFNNESKWTSWMYRVTLNTAITHSNKQKKRRPAELDFELLQPAKRDPVFEERLELLYNYIKQLSLVNKSLILLYLEGKSHQEIAEITGFSKTNVGTRLARIKQKLKSQILN